MGWHEDNAAMAQRKRPVRARSKATVQTRIEAAAQRLEFSSSDFGALVSKKASPERGDRMVRLGRWRAKLVGNLSSTCRLLSSAAQSLTEAMAAAESAGPRLHEQRSREQARGRRADRDVGNSPTVDGWSSGYDSPRGHAGDPRRHPGATDPDCLPVRGYRQPH
jgi:hypothetical protein